MSREFKPGDVAMVTFDNASIAMRQKGRTDITTSIGLRREDDWALPSYGTSIDHSHVTDVRPLVVIDPESVVFDGQADDDWDRIAEIVNCLRRIAEGDGRGSWRATLCLRLADEFERQNRTAKPDEPRGLGAVIEAVYDNRFVHIGGGKWKRVGGGEPCAYDEINVVRILSGGVA